MRAGSLVLQNDETLTRLPADLKVGFKFTIRDCPQFRSVDSTLRVAGTLCLERLRRFESLPSGFDVGGSLRIIGAPRLTAIPDGLRAGGPLVIRGCSNLRSFGEGVEARSLTIVSQTHRFDLPPVKLEHSLVLVNTSVTRLPALPPLSIDLVLIRCHDLTDLGPAIDVGRQFAVRDCRRIERLPDQIAAQSITISDCPIESFPSPVRDASSIELINCKRLARMPASLRVTRDLSIAGANALRDLGDRLEVGCELSIHDCPALEHLPEHLSSQEITIRRCGIRRLPLPRVDCMRIELLDCPRLTELPAGLVVRGTLQLNGCRSLTTISRNTKVGLLDVSDCIALTSLPDDLQVNTIELAGSGLTSLPDSLKRVHLSWRGVHVSQQVVFRPEEFSAEEVLAMENVERRRVLIERLGMDRIIEQLGERVEVRHEDLDAGGPRRLIVIRPSGRFAEDLVSLECRCPSTGRVYHLRVPPETETCHHAAAWLAGFDNPDDYKPLVET